MKGFDPKWKDFPDYIIGITKEIWEDRGVASLHHYYSDDIPVRSPSSIVIGNHGVIAATLATIAEFPDRQLLGEDVIWSGSPEEGMLSSHRIVTTATHSGDGIYGKATGKQLTYRVIADCHAINNQINDEWLIRDQGAIVRQLGIDPKAYARDLITREGGPEECVAPYTPANDVKGPYQGTGNNNEWCQRYAEILTRLMSADFAAIPQTYDRAAALCFAGGVETLSFEGANQFWMGLRSSFPGADFSIHHAIGRDDPALPPRAALRWSLHGTHDGWGSFGQPTGAEVFILGASHAEFGAVVSGKPLLRREWALYDETAIWKQILLQTGDL